MLSSGVVRFVRSIREEERELSDKDSDPTPIDRGCIICSVIGMGTAQNLDRSDPVAVWDEPILSPTRKSLADPFGQICRGPVVLRHAVDIKVDRDDVGGPGEG
jgi:hypothetical protein